VARLHELEGVHDGSLHRSINPQSVVVILVKTQIHQVTDVARRYAIQRDTSDVSQQFRIIADGRVVSRQGLDHFEHGRFMHIFNGFEFGQHAGILRLRRRQNCARGRGSASTAAQHFRTWFVLVAFWAGLALASVAQGSPALELLVLGSGGPGAAGRASSAYLLLLDGKPRILVDAGPGSFARLGESGEALADTDIVLLTHLHIDHAGELPGLFKARAVSGSGPIIFQVWGPDGAAAQGESAYFPSTRRFIELLFGRQGAFAYLHDFAAPIDIQAHDIPARITPLTRPQVIHQEEGLTISAIAGHHGDAPAVIYRIDCAGKSITFSGDIDANGLSALRRIARGTDLLVFNTVVLDPPGSPPILYTLHTPPQKIGELAREIGAHALLLSHLSPATDQEHDAVLESIRRAYLGTVQFAQDGMRLRP
jgi:ribonuclease BN (tRNA processing enzyme)